MSDKVLHSLGFRRPLSFRSTQRRPRFLILVLVVGLFFYSVRSSKFRSNGQSRIQAVFPTELTAAKSIRLRRQDQVRDAFKHAWRGYEEHAWLHDEVMPLSGGHKDTFVGWAATLVDALDTLYIMGLEDEFKEALKALKQVDFSKPNSDNVPVFETTIRYLGGLLGAWDISGHEYPILFEKARELGDFLYRAFDTECGAPVPYYYWKQHNPKDGELLGENGVIIAQIGSLSLEFIRLSQITGDPKYMNAIQRITDQLESTQNYTSLPGMWPSQVDTTGPQLSFSSRAYTLGAFADSLFEYLPKTHLLLSGASQQYLSMHRAAYASYSKNLFFRPSVPGNPDILFSGSLNTVSTEIDTQVQHLACFVGGMVGLGSRINDSPHNRHTSRRPRDSLDELDTARRLTDGCVWAYENTPSGIMPEIFHVNKCPDLSPCSWKGKGAGFSRVDDSSYQLRPEAIESVFIMYRLTGDTTWQDKGWRMFEAIVKHTKTDIANARIRNVMDVNPAKDDSMESFWLAETLKYFYLLFSDPGMVSLDEFVLNTEAHPLRWRGS